MELLCDYGSSSGSENEEPEPPKKAKRLPSVPNQIQDMFKEKVDKRETESREEVHQGRIRTFAHARGNWATCLFAELKRPLVEDLTTLATRLHLAADNVSVKIQPDLHLSLSRTVAFPSHWMDSFIRKISKDIGTKVSGGFPLFWDPELSVFVNDERTRTFVGLRVTADAHLRSIVEIIDREFSDLKLPVFYVPPAFHVSLLWTLGDKEPEMRRLVTDLNKVVKEAIEDGTLENEGGFTQRVDRVVCKSGNKTFHIQCSKSTR